MKNQHIDKKFEMRLQEIKLTINEMKNCQLIIITNLVIIYDYL